MYPSYEDSQILKIIVQNHKNKLQAEIESCDKWLQEIDRSEKHKQARDLEMRTCENCHTTQIDIISTEHNYYPLIICQTCVDKVKTNELKLCAQSDGYITELCIASTKDNSCDRCHKKDFKHTELNLMFHKEQPYYLCDLCFEAAKLEVDDFTSPLDVHS